MYSSWVGANMMHKLAKAGNGGPPRLQRRQWQETVVSIERVTPIYTLTYYNAHYNEPQEGVYQFWETPIYHPRKPLTSSPLQS